MEISGLNHKGQSFILLINVKMPTIVGILTISGRINFVLSLVEYEISFITSGMGLCLTLLETQSNDFYNGNDPKF